MIEVIGSGYYEMSEEIYGQNKIDWCDSTWNPITGCLHRCEYCYARGIAERFGGKQKYANIFDESEPIKGIGKQMVISLFRKGKITWTKFKVRNKEKMDCLPYLYLKFEIDVTNPIKESSRAIYFEKEGDWLNKK